MPIRTRLLNPLKVVVCVVRESLSKEDLLAFRAATTRVLGDDASHRLLFDLRRVAGYPISNDQLRSFAGFGVGRSRRFTHIAILAPDDLAYGMARIYQAYATRYDAATLRVFRDSRKAWSWIQAPERD